MILRQINVNSLIDTVVQKLQVQSVSWVAGMQPVEEIAQHTLTRVVDGSEPSRGFTTTRPDITQHPSSKRKDDSTATKEEKLTVGVCTARKNSMI